MKTVDPVLWFTPFLFTRAHVSIGSINARWSAIRSYCQAIRRYYGFNCYSMYPLLSRKPRMWINRDREFLLTHENENLGKRSVGKNK